MPEPSRKERAVTSAKHILVLAVAIGAPALAAAPASAVETVVLVAENNGETRTIPAQSIIEVRLPGASEAGPRWINKSTPGAVRLATVDYRPVVRDEEVVPEEWLEVFYFEPTTSGEAELRLLYLNNWEGVALDTYSVTLEIR